MTSGLADTVPADALRERVRAVVQEQAPALLALSHAIAADPELAYAEHRAAARCAEVLEAGGYTVERPAYGLDTAFAARAGAPGLHVLICAEYDALPDIGHACGHNIIAAAAVGAGLALAEVAPSAGLRVTVLGTPAEERYGGKVPLLRAGAFDGVEAAMMIHPSAYDDYAPRTLAIEDLICTYTGREAHASATPWLGRNALDGCVAGYTAIAMLRQHLRAGQQVHGIIEHGGEAPNIVPSMTRARYFIRARTIEDLADLRSRVQACLEGAATATGTTVGVTGEGATYEPLEVHPGLSAMFTAACEEIGRPLFPPPSDDPAGSTDFGNVTRVVPSIHPMLSIRSLPAQNHQREFTEHAVTPDADRAVLDGATAMALTAVSLGRDPGVLRAAAE